MSQQNFKGCMLYCIKACSKKKNFMKASHVNMLTRKMAKVKEEWAGEQTCHSSRYRQ
jgi:hypothetical protein